MFLTVDFLLFFPLLTSQGANFGALEDEVRAHLEDLRTLVTLTISNALSDLYDLTYDLESTSFDAKIAGHGIMEKEYQAANSQVATFHYLAAMSGKNVSGCTSDNLATIVQMDTEAKSRLSNEINQILFNGSDYLDAAKYRIDIVINMLGDLEFQLNRCGGVKSCVSSIETKITKSAVRLPQDITSHVTEAASFIGNVKLMMRERTDSNVANFTASVAALVEQIISCAN